MNSQASSLVSPFPPKFAKHVLAVAPKISQRALALAPDKLKLVILTALMNKVLMTQLQDEELEFLHGKWVEINISDIALTFQVSMGSELLIATDKPADVTFSANVPELLLIASGKEDPDTLFFQRKLLIDGDTELGLEVKNLLLSIELDSLPQPVKLAIEKLSNTLVYLQKQDVM